MNNFSGLISRTKKEHKFFWKITIDVVAVLAQLSGHIIWPIMEYQKDNENWKVFLVPASTFMISLGWWENYVDKSSYFRCIKFLGRVKVRLFRTRYFTYMFVSLWKILVVFCIMVISMGLRLSNFQTVFELGTAFYAHPINITQHRTSLPADSIPDISRVRPLEVIFQIYSNGITPFYVFLLATISAWLCYIVGKFACKIHIQGFSFAFPVNLTVPVCISLIITACGLRYEDPCSFDFMPAYLFWECKNGDVLQDFLKTNVSTVLNYKMLFRFIIIILNFFCFMLHFI